MRSSVFLTVTTDFHCLSNSRNKLFFISLAIFLGVSQFQPVHSCQRHLHIGFLHYFEGHRRKFKEKEVILSI